jgi:hypothetical protein
MKNKLKKLVVWFSVLFSASCLLLGVVYGVSKASLDLADYLFPEYVVPGVSVVRAEEVSDMPLRLWAMNEAFDNSLNPDTFDCVIKNESGYNPNAYNVNKGGTVDFGLCEWNSQHIKSGFISLECASSPTCCVKRMIEKVKADKGYGAWYAYNDKCKGKKVFIK